MKTPAAVSALVVVAVVAFAAGRATSHAARPVPAADAQAPRVQPVAASTHATFSPFQRSGDCSRDVEALEVRSKDLEQQLDFQRWIAESYRTAKSGTPVPWTDDIPHELRPDEFEKAVKETLAKCGAGASLAGLDCHEAPCIASIRASDDGWLDMMKCEPWKSAYGAQASVRIDQVECPGGRTEHVGMISAMPDAWAANTELAENLTKRRAERWETLDEAWQCAP